MDQTFSATLPGFQAYAIRDEAFPAICPCPGNNLGGVLYYPQERRDVICLHRFEENYTPFTMPVFRNGVPILAQVFINGDGFDVTNEVWTLEKFQASEKSEFLRDIRAFMAHAWAMGWVDRFR